MRRTHHPSQVGCLPGRDAVSEMEHDVLIRGATVGRAAFQLR